MAISANSIFHFTNSRYSLESILKGEFKISYCLENFSLNSRKYSYGIPMVSFCDIPLSQVRRHLDKYGGYGIGLSNKWAISNKINPVLYIQQNAQIAHLFQPFFDSYFKIKAKIQNEVIYELKISQSKIDFNIPDISSADLFNINTVLGLISVIKNYNGQLFRKGKLIQEEYKFYDEREWRFVPEYLSDKSNYIFPISESKYMNWRGDDKKKPFIEGLSLRFNSNDIKYIIVQKDNQIKYIVKKLEECKNLYKTSEELMMLISRIITVEQIISDF